MRLKPIAVASASLLALAAAAFAQQEPPAGGKPPEARKPADEKKSPAKSVTVTGQVVDLASMFATSTTPPAAPGAAGEKPSGEPGDKPGEKAAPDEPAAAKAAMPAGKGGWLGIVDEKTGDFYLATEKGFRPSEKLREFAGQRATVEGKGAAAGGLKAVVVETATKAEGSKPAGTPAEASARKAREATVTGPIVNVAHVLESASRSENHVCDAKCIEAGAPVGVLDERGGQLYLAVNAGKDPIETLRPLAGSKARVTGKAVGNLLVVEKADKAEGASGKP